MKITNIKLIKYDWTTGWAHAIMDDESCLWIEEFTKMDYWVGSFGPFSEMEFKKLKDIKNYLFDKGRVYEEGNIDQDIILQEHNCKF